MKRKRKLVPEIQVNKQETNQNHKKSTKMIKKIKTCLHRLKKKKTWDVRLQYYDLLLYTSCHQWFLKKVVYFFKHSIFSFTNFSQ